MTQLELELQDDAAAAAADANPDNYESALGKAVAYWLRGRLLPRMLAEELMSKGYDVGALEAKHLKV